MYSLLVCLPTYVPSSLKVQLRCLKDVPAFDLEFYPCEGQVFPHYINKKDAFKKAMNKNSSLHESYIRGVTAKMIPEGKFGVKASPSATIHLTIVSPLAGGIVEEDGPETWKPKEMSPYWALCRAPKGSKASANMAVYRSAFKYADPKLPNKNNNLACFNMGMHVELPVIKNAKALKKGDILTLPTDLGLDDILLKDNMSTHTESWLKQPK